MLLAAAYAGMQPSPATWTKYLAEIDMLESTSAVSADEAVILRTSRVSRQSLMEETLGDSDAVSAESPLVALERIKSEATAPLEELVRELEARASQATTVANTASADWLAQVEARETAEAELQEARRVAATTASRLEAMQQAEATKLMNVRSHAQTAARRWRTFIAWAVRGGVVAVIVWATVVFVTLPDPADRTGAVIVGVAGMIALALAVLPPVGKVLDPVENAIARVGERRRLINLGFSADAMQTIQALAPDLPQPTSK
jgi:roadblock/LC7 domain-containing protein